MELINSEDKYRSMPDHSHYTLCSDRITSINEKGKKAFYYTFIVSLLLSAGSMFNIRFNILSLLSDLMVGNGETGSTGLILSAMLNIISSVFLLLLAIFGKAKYKFCNVILFSIYLAMPFSCLINPGGRKSDIITLAIGVAGAYIYFPMLSAWRDYRVISKAEGFPYFSERFTHQLENPHYKSENYHEDYADDEKPMDEIEKNLTDNIKEQDGISVKHTSQKISMDIPSEIPADIPHRGDGKKRREKEKNKKSSLELARELAERANKFDFEIENIPSDKDKNKNKEKKNNVR